MSEAPRDPVEKLNSASKSFDVARLFRSALLAERAGREYSATVGELMLSDLLSQGFTEAEIDQMIEDESELEYTQHTTEIVDSHISSLDVDAQAVIRALVWVDEPSLED
jgi:hypothetical protein